MFSRYLRVLAHVPRWVVVPVIRRQNVAEHSFFVAHYVAELLDHPVFKNKHSDWKYAAMRYAVMHDRSEARTGDFPGPIKRMMQDPVRRMRLEEKAEASLGPAPYKDDLIRRVVKAADTIEEYFYLCSEQQMGSRVVEVLIFEGMDRMARALRDIDCYDLMDKIVGEAHAFERGLSTLTDDTDLPPEPEDIPFPA